MNFAVVHRLHIHSRSRIPLEAGRGCVDKAGYQFGHFFICKEKQFDVGKRLLRFDWSTINKSFRIGAMMTCRHPAEAIKTAVNE